MDAVDQFLAAPANIDLVWEIGERWPRIKKELVERFWESLRLRLEKQLKGHADWRVEFERAKDQVYILVQRLAGPLLFAVGCEQVRPGQTRKL
jgi:hypothetical protein